MISIDVTLLFQLANFLVTLAILNYLIIRPVRAIMAERRARNDGLKGDADALSDQAARKLESYEARLAHARAELAQVRDQGKQAGETAAQSRLELASTEARGIRLQATERLQQESQEARRVLDERVADFAGTAVRRMLGA